MMLYVFLWERDLAVMVFWLEATSTKGDTSLPKGRRRAQHLAD
jgi:hypothetical protein